MSTQGVGGTMTEKQDSYKKQDDKNSKNNKKKKASLQPASGHPV